MNELKNEDIHKIKWRAATEREKEDILSWGAAISKRRKADNLFEKVKEVLIIIASILLGIFFGGVSFFYIFIDKNGLDTEMECFFICISIVSILTAGWSIINFRSFFRNDELCLAMIRSGKIQVTDVTLVDKERDDGECYMKVCYSNGTTDVWACDERDYKEADLSATLIVIKYPGKKVEGFYDKRDVHLVRNYIMQ